MKSNVMISLGLVLVFFLTTDVLAQRGGRFDETRQPRSEQAQPRMLHKQDMDACTNRLNLTEAQQAQMKNLHLARTEKSLKHRNQMEALRVKKQGLMLEKNPNQAAVNAVIDEMTALQNVQMKERFAHRQEVRQMLTDEQRVIFDSMTSGRKNMKGRGQGTHAPSMPRGRR
jgi:Spy/CpxP family protein refolding chaperone